MLKGNITVVVILGGLVVVLLLVWQVFLNSKLANETIACGGDWSYRAQCPLGSYCKSLGQGPMAGGICTPFISLPIKRGIQSDTEGSCQCDLGSVVGNDCVFLKKPVCIDKFTCQCQLVGS